MYGSSWKAIESGGALRENLFAKKLSTIIILRITEYTGRMSERVLAPSLLTPSTLAA